MHRLHFDLGVAIEDIDATGVLSIPVQNGPDGVAGLIHHAAQRDLVRWPGRAPTEGFPLPFPLAPGTFDTERRVQSVLKDFCPNLNCVYSYCPVHGWYAATLYRRLLTLCAVHS